MALNPFFLQGSQGEQSLVQDLINEQLRMYGVEVYYLPRQYVTKNKIIREVITSEFNQSYPIEAYVDNFDGYGDNTVLLSKFGVQATNELKLIISQERFSSYITPLIKNLPNIELATRPKEGDLIYFPLGDRLFEIKFVEHEKPFYQLQKNYVYELTCELFRGEDEILDTGVEEIDDTFNVEGNIRSLTLVGSGSTATAFSGRIISGAVNQIIVTSRGEKYNHPPTVAISSAPTGGTRATGISTLRNDIVNCDGTLIGEKVQGVFIVNPGAGYTANPGIVFVGVSTNPGVGAAATTRISDNTVGIVTISDGGGGYVSAPTVTFSSPGIGTTAQGVAVVSAAGTVSAIYLTNAGAGYTVAPTITLSAPDLSGSGDFIPTETITGSTSGVTGIVKTWNSVTNILTYSNVSGDFVAGETITGSESSASYKIRVIEDDNTVNNYPDNDEIKLSARDGILDFSESNPFGNP
jgi:hypothetical protein